MARPPVKAQELADTLAAQIRAGEITLGSWLPSERQLAEAHGVGRSTARQAAQILTEGGLIEHVAGAGTRVRVVPPAGDDDLRAELRAVHLRMAEMDGRLEALEARFGPSVPEV